MIINVYCVYVLFVIGPVLGVLFLSLLVVSFIIFNYKL